MKLNKKKVFALALAVCMVAILSFSTLAWFSDSDSVDNKFQIADSTQQPDKIFSVDVREKVDIDGDGVFDPDKDATVDVDDVPNGGHTYEDILPGKKLYKEPIVVNTGAYSQYVRVKVTIDNADTWKALLEKYHLDLVDVFDGHAEAKWPRYDAPTWSADGKKITYVFYLARVLNPTERESLFTHVMIPKQFTQHDMAHFVAGAFSMNIVAEAIQSEYTGDNAYSAFAVVEQDQTI